MLGLKLRTDPRWVELCQSNIQEILSDHFWCEHKAASNAMMLIVLNSEKEELVSEMLKIAQEETEHSVMVHNIIKERGLELNRERKDDYVGELFKFMKKDGSRQHALTDRLLFAAVIEARSCERFRVLSENVQDEKLSNFYNELMISEASHYTTFLNFARQYGESVEKVNSRWKEWLAFEDEIIRNYGNKETVHG
jgi:tRNA-(ms[2]io[6]A)-hydroxylase